MIFRLIMGPQFLGEVELEVMISKKLELVPEPNRGISLVAARRRHHHLQSFQSFPLILEPMEEFFNRVLGRNGWLFGPGMGMTRLDLLIGFHSLDPCVNFSRRRVDCLTLTFIFSPCCIVIRFAALRKGDHAVHF